MIIALINKIKGKLVITDVMNASPKDLLLIDYYVRLDNNTRIFYNELKSKGYIVSINEKAFLKKEIIKDDLIFTSLEFKKPDEAELTELDIKKEKYFSSMDTYLSNHVNKIQWFKYIEFISIFNQFASKGLFITDNNKEDMYIKILEDGDEGTLEALEFYLTLQDEINPFIQLHFKILRIKEEVEYSDEEEFEEILEKYPQYSKVSL